MHQCQKEKIENICQQPALGVSDFSRTNQINNCWFETPFCHTRLCSTLCFRRWYIESSYRKRHRLQDFPCCSSILGFSRSAVSQQPQCKVLILLPPLTDFLNSNTKRESVFFTTAIQSAKNLVNDGFIKRESSERKMQHFAMKYLGLIFMYAI